MNNYKIQFRFKWAKYCVSSASANDESDGGSANIVLDKKDQKKFSPVITLLTTENQIRSKHFIKGSKRSAYLKEDIYIYIYIYIYIRLFVWIYWNQDNDAKTNKAERFYLPKNMIKDCNVIITGKTFMTSQVVLTIKRYKEIRKQKTSQEKD